MFIGAVKYLECSALAQKVMWLYIVIISSIDIDYRLKVTF